jgi:ankyrin repeat protein
MKSKLLSLLCLALVVTVVSAGEKQHDETLTEDLLLAAVNKKVEDTKSLLARNANPNAVNKEGTPLLMAVLLSMQFDAKELASGTISGDRQCSETVQITKHLLDAGANPNATNQEGDPVLMAAFTRGDPGIVADLIRAGASVKGVDSKGSL